MAAPAIHEWLKMHIDLCKRVEADGKRMVGGDLVQRRLLDEGVVYRNHGLPKWLDYGEPKMCFGNSMMLAVEHPDLTYVEGFAHRFIPCHHAWCIDPDGAVIDVTWKPFESDDPIEQWEYLGIAFETEFVCKTVAKHGTYGLFDKPGVFEQGGR